MTASSSSSSCKKRLWKSAIGKVVDDNNREKEEQQPPHDPVGERIAALMLSTDFSLVKDTIRFRWTPLLSTHNVRWLLQSRKQSTTRRSCPRPSWTNVLVFFCQTTAILFLVTFIGISMACVWALKTLYYLLIYLVVCLIDCNGVQPIVAVVRACFQWCDAVLLQGNRYKGRTWNATGEYEVTSSAVKSANDDTQQLLLSPSHRPSGLSQSTALHLDALSYCASHLQQEQDRSNAKRKQKLLERSKKSGIQRLDAVTLVTTGKQTRKQSLDGLTSPREEFELQMNVTEDLVELMNSSDDEDDDRVDQIDLCSSPTAENEELAWFDVGAKIGMRLLHSEHVQRAIASQDTKDRLLESIQHRGGTDLDLSDATIEDEQQAQEQQQQTVSKPVHSMWTSPTVKEEEGQSETVTNSNEDLPISPPPSPLRTTRSRQRKQRPTIRREPLAPGIKITVPLTPLQPLMRSSSSANRSYQMATVAESKRIYVGNADGTDREPNCISVSVKLEKSFLRNGAFADLTFRVMDYWTSPRYMPRHSKVPIGSCVATAYGCGVLVGWRVSDDCHIVLASRGSHTYLHRDAIHSTLEAAVGFHVLTSQYGWGVVQACSSIANQYANCRFHVTITDVGEYTGQTLEVARQDVLSCPGAQFMPVIEHVRAAASYQIQVDQYKALLRIGNKEEEEEILHTGSVCTEILWNSFLKAIGEDAEFDNGVKAFMSSLSQFLDRLDQKRSEGGGGDQEDHSSISIEQTRTFESSDEPEIEVQLAPLIEEESPAGFWIVNDLFGGFFQGPQPETPASRPTSSSSAPCDASQRTKRNSGYDRAFTALRTIMKTVSIGRASSVDHPHFRMALAIAYDFLLFVRTIIKIQQRNDSETSLSIWKRAGLEIKSTFGPIKERIESIGKGIALRMEHQGRMAKVRVLKLFERILNDERLIFELEQGEWERCFARLEIALVETEIVEESKLLYYRKAANFIHGQARMLIGGNASAATRNTEKLVLLGAIIQACAAPRRSVLKFFLRDDMLELFERILVRAYHKEEVATRMLTIHAANFHSLRHLRMLKDFSVAGKIWIPLLDAADEEFSWLVSKMPEKSKSILCPLSSLFSLCVAQFHRINAGDLSKDWLAFLLEEDSVRIVHDLNMRLILALESFSQDIKEMMMVLPYYPSIDVDILNLMDEINIDEFVKEASGVIDDPEKLSGYIREKATIGIERFLNYLPKMSIPVEKRDLGDGWVLSCHGKEGGDLTLKDVTIRRDNVVCQVLGGDTLFFPMFDETNRQDNQGDVNMTDKNQTANRDEDCVLQHIRALLLNAQGDGVWTEGVGGVFQPPTDRYAALVLQGIPVSSVLNCSIDLWRDQEIDDDELLEIAIRDISYHIQLQKQREDAPAETTNTQTTESIDSRAPESWQNAVSLSTSSSSDSLRRRFNPRSDPTVLFLQIRRLTLNVDDFGFRIEKAARATIFDPVLEGQGSLSLQSISIRVRIECAKEKARKSPLGADVFTPVFLLSELDVSLDKLQMNVTDTGFGSDWIVNKAVTVFEDKLTEIVEINLRDQIKHQLKNLIDSLNSYFLMNPNLLLGILGVSIDDLDETHHDHE